ncbi:bacillithiol biosynthesis cysteine-adding enzyme BshC [Planococcus sp. FY231025]|uniref:bacillithiol biosynthesis cysteine-adding enzyme BshC n=1 Tax=Planococcus sp. FY231025 TaxID=3455699 RepID=UPI003F91A8F7
MKITEHYIEPSSRLMEDYINGRPEIQQFFSYKPEAGSFSTRLEKLKEHPVRREELAGIIRAYMEPRGLSEKARQHLADFEEGAHVVVTGQQAGLLTGPLYTIHKAISVIVLAKKASEQLNTKIVPVFWIAGEDHDLAEISHLYRDVNGRLDKLNIPHTEYGKNSASTAALNKSTIKSYLTEYFRSMPETAYSKELHGLAFAFLDEAATFTDFFASFLNHFFQKEGLLYIDAADPRLRRYESAYFQEMIEKAEAIAQSVFETEAELSPSYNTVIGAEQEAANLFITVHGERILLSREGGRFVGKGTDISYSREELLDIARTNPELLSNNVVTRPLMQEMVFPVLAFVGGPGEVAYWAALKGAFDVMGMEMPVVMPRLNITLVNRHVQSLLDKYGLTVPQVISERKVAQMRLELMDSIREKEAEALVERTKEGLVAAYKEIEAAFTAISGGLTPLVEKNLGIHLKQLNFLKNKLEDEVILQNSTQFAHFDLLEMELLPNEGLQERVFSPFPYLNAYGPDLVRRLLALEMDYNKNHKIVSL